MAVDRAVHLRPRERIPSTAAASTRRSSRASWATTCASTSSAVRRTRRRRPACPCTARHRSCGTRSSSRADARPARAAAADEPARSSDESGSATGSVRVKESVENLSGVDRPVGWTEHVTLGPPFLREGCDRVPRVGLALESVRAALRERRLPRARRRVRLARRARPGGGTADLRRSSAGRARAPIRLT